MKRFYVDFYDMIDGWGIFGFFPDKLFDNLDDAIELCNNLNDELPESNKRCGEHFGVIDKNTNREIFCGMDERYKMKMVETISDIFKNIKGDVLHGY